jgi:hypothetical protein
MIMSSDAPAPTTVSGQEEVPQADAARWTPEHENIIIEWADKAACYRWLHGKCHAQYRNSNYWFTLPVIVMSTITGTANFAQDRFDDSIKPWVAIVIGAVNIFAGILTTIQQFLKIGELNEAHRVSSIAWDKFYRNMKVELAKAPRERTPVLQQLKGAKEEFDRLMETSPAITEAVVAEFKRVFSCSALASRADIEADTSARRFAFAQLKKPEICDSIETTRSCVYKAPLDALPPSPTKQRAAAAAQEAAAREAAAGSRASATEAFKSRRGRPPSEVELAELIQEASAGSLESRGNVVMAISDAIPGAGGGATGAEPADGDDPAT